MSGFQRKFKFNNRFYYLLLTKMVTSTYVYDSNFFDELYNDYEFLTIMLFTIEFLPLFSIHFYRKASFSFLIYNGNNFTGSTFFCYSLKTLYQLCEEEDQTLLIVQTTTNEVWSLFFSLNVILYYFTEEDFSTRLLKSEIHERK